MSAIANLPVTAFGLVAVVLVSLALVALPVVAFTLGHVGFLRLARFEWRVAQERRRNRGGDVSGSRADTIDHRLGLSAGNIGDAEIAPELIDGEPEGS